MHNCLFNPNLLFRMKTFFFFIRGYFSSLPFFLSFLKIIIQPFGVAFGEQLYNQRATT